MSGPLTDISDKSLRWAIRAPGKLLGTTERVLRLRRRITLRPHHRLTVVCLQLEPLLPGRSCRRAQCAFALLVCHLDGFAEMSDCLLEGGAAKRLVAGFSPPFDRGVGKARLGKVMRQHFRLGRYRVGKTVAQALGNTAM